MLHAANVPVWLRIAAAGLSKLNIAGASRVLWTTQVSKPEYTPNSLATRFSSST